MKVVPEMESEEFFISFLPLAVLSLVSFLWVKKKSNDDAPKRFHAMASAQVVFIAISSFVSLILLITFIVQPPS